MVDIFIAIALWTMPAMLEDGKCSVCKRFGVNSTVTMDNFGSCTLVNCMPGHYNENGEYVAGPACNTCSVSGRCSRGHQVAMVVRSN